MGEIFKSLNNFLISFVRESTCFQCETVANSDGQLSTSIVPVVNYVVNHFVKKVV